MEITSKDFEGYFEDDETKKLSNEVAESFKGTNFEAIKVKVLKNKENYYQINHFIPNFDIFDVFFEKGIKNVGQLDLIEEEADYLFKNELLVENKG